MSQSEKIQNQKDVTFIPSSRPIRYYRHGWQSWSLTLWQDVEQRVPTPKPAILHPLQTDPFHIHDARPHGSWVGVVEMENGLFFLLGALDLDAHVFFDDNTLIGKYENNAGDWFVAEGSEEEVFSFYAAELAQRLGKNRATETPRIWCSWYSFYTHISENNLGEVLNDLGELPFDVFQVDDGWQHAIGDWIPNDKFPGGMDHLAAQIRRSGRTPGLWLAPLIVSPSSNLFRQHPDWLLRDKKGKLASAGFNWGEPLFALDPSIPAVMEWLSALMAQVRSWGYDYVKLDFLYAGALPGVRQNDISREQAYRQALRVMRNALGDAYLLTCGAPIIPSLGLCDGLRIGPDVASHWSSPRDDDLLGNFAIPGTRNAIRTTVNRLWLAPLVHTDPDIVYFASDKNMLTDEQERMLQDLALICNFKANSDPPSWLREEDRVKLIKFLQASPKVIKKGRYQYLLDDRKVDFSAAMPIPESKGFGRRALGVILGWGGNSPTVLRFFQWLGNREIKGQLQE